MKSNFTGVESSDYVVFNKEDHAKEALIAADHHQNSKLVVYSLECIITVSSYKFKDKVYILFMWITH
ncbi:869_t:CDS:2 [Entrophospora sp. SA101]|nr:869_t:CDS:2 [Entrophospora sp. SA101]